MSFGSLPLIVFCPVPLHRRLHRFLPPLASAPHAVGGALLLLVPCLTLHGAFSFPLLHCPLPSTNSSLYGNLPSVACHLSISHVHTAIFAA